MFMTGFNFAWGAASFLAVMWGLRAIILNIGEMRDEHRENLKPKAKPPIQTTELMEFPFSSIEESLLDAVTFIAKETRKAPTVCRISLNGFDALIKGTGVRAVFEARGENKGMLLHTVCGELFVYPDHSLNDGEGRLGETVLKLVA